MLIFLFVAGFRLLCVEEGEKGEKIGEKVGKWWCGSEVSTIVIHCKLVDYTRLFRDQTISGLQPERRKEKL